MNGRRQNDPLIRFPEYRSKDRIDGRLRSQFAEPIIRIATRPPDAATLPAEFKAVCVLGRIGTNWNQNGVYAVCK